MAKLNKEYFTREEILLDLLKSVNYSIEEGGSVDTEEMFNNTFNTDYYIIGTYEAKQALEQYGVFDALDEVINRQIEFSGEFTPDFVKDFSDPEKLANLLYYVKADNLCEQLGLYDNEEIDLNQLKELKNKIEEEIKG